MSSPRDSPANSNLESANFRNGWRKEDAVPHSIRVDVLRRGFHWRSGCGDHRGRSGQPKRGWRVHLHDHEDVHELESPIRGAEFLDSAPARPAWPRGSFPHCLGSHHLWAMGAGGSPTAAAPRKSPRSPMLAREPSAPSPAPSHTPCELDGAVAGPLPRKSGRKDDGVGDPSLVPPTPSR